MSHYTGQSHPQSHKAKSRGEKKSFHARVPVRARDKKKRQKRGENKKAGKEGDKLGDKGEIIMTGCNGNKNEGRQVRRQRRNHETQRGGIGTQAIVVIVCVRANASMKQENLESVEPF